ncbi:MAG TPA: hypothetical protein VHV31_08850, partial [Nitrolancea sp.]|nr:hypothetical protein [Nitrolancea sp.]
METFFLFCFLFGAVFTAVSVLLGFSGSLSIHVPGGHGGSTAVSHVGQGHLSSTHAQPSTNHAGSHASDHVEHATPFPVHVHLPVFNPSALLAFTTCFGATGYILTRFANWPVLIATPVAIVPGLLADL